MNRVRVVYIVSSDRNEINDIKKAIESAILRIRGWYEEQLDGQTFVLNDPIVEVYQSDKNANWFTTNNPNKGNIDDRGYYNSQMMVPSEFPLSVQIWRRGLQAKSRMISRV